MLLLSLLPSPAHAAAEAALTGVVRDLQGRPQAGAVVELLYADTAVVARAVTDNQGRYLLTALMPGTYQLRATAAFLLPAWRDHLKLQAGGRTTADLTLTAIFSAGLGLPAQKRGSDESDDDWKWALRSAANRPLLRLADDDEAAAAVKEADTRDGAGRQTVRRVEASSGSAAFANGGPRAALSVASGDGAGNQTSARVEFGDAAISGGAPPVDASVSSDRQGPMGRRTHLLVGFSSHPELTGAAGSGLQIVQLASAEQFSLGDAVVIDAGTLLTAERLLESRVFSTPFLHIKVHVNEGTSLEYRVMEGHTDGSVGSGEMRAPANALVDANGRPLRDAGLYQELAANKRAADGKNVLRVTLAYASSSVDGVGGSGQLAPAELAGLPILADDETGTFRVALREHAAVGLGAAWEHELTPAISASLQAAVATTPVLEGGNQALSTLQQAVRSQVREAIRASLEAHSQHLGAKVNAEYRWQPEDTIGEVVALDGEPTEAYLSFMLRQRLGTGRHLRGVDAVIEATNLLAQGYQPVVGPDGETLFLAHTPRALRAGLSFSF